MDQFFDCLINLDTFSRLAPNTDIHLSKTGYFVPTAGKLSSMIGAQTISNFYNGYHPNQLINDLEDFAQRLVRVIEDLYNMAKEDDELKIEVACKIAIVNRDFKAARVGLECLMNTYKHTDIYDRLVDMTSYLSNHIKKFKTLTKTWHEVTCPETNFSDDDWEQYIKNSKNRLYETVGFYKYYLQYSSSLLYNQTMTNMKIWQWYNLIHEFDNGTKIYLGGMPLKSGSMNVEKRDDLQTLNDMGVKAILSVVEGFENRSDGYMYSPIAPEQWEEVGIKYCQIPIPDFGTVSLDKIHICVEYIHWNIKNNRSVYTSCRIGKNRSNLVLMGYFVKYLNYTSQEAYEYIKSKRVQVQNKHFKMLQQYEQMIK